MTKPTKWLCAQQRLRSAWASAQSGQSLLCSQWVAKDPSFLHEDSEDSDQTEWMPRLIWVFAGHTATLLVLSWGGSNGSAVQGIYWGFASRKINIPAIPWPPRSHGYKWLVPNLKWALSQENLSSGVATQTSLLSYRSQLESWNFGFSR